MLSRACLAVVAVVFVAMACGDDGGSSSPNDTGVKSDGAAVSRDAAVPTGDGNVLPWPDSKVEPDVTGQACTPGSATMCDSNKNYNCVSGKCAKCPANYVDCDRSGSCECFGACNGTKCVTGGGGGGGGGGGKKP